MSSSTASTSPTPTTCITSLLEHDTPTKDQVFKSSIAMSTFPLTLNIEPLPHLDFFLLNSLITLLHPHLDKHRLKRIEYMVDARRSFYEGHEKHQSAYRDLIDANACDDILTAESERLSRLIKETPDDDAGRAAAITLQKRLSWVETQQRSNEVDMRTRLDKLRERTKLRAYITLWYSQLKTVFVRDEMPWLIEMGKQCLKRDGEAGATQQGLSSSSVKDLGQGTGNSDHCDDSGGTSTPEVGMRMEGVEIGEGEGVEEEGIEMGAGEGVDEEGML